MPVNLLGFLKERRWGVYLQEYGGSPYKSCTKKPLPSRDDSFLYIYIESIPSLLALPQDPRGHKQLGQNYKQFFGRGSCILRGGSPSLYERSSKVNKPSRNDLFQAGPTESWRYGSLAQRIILYNRGWIYRETGNLVTAGWWKGERVLLCWVYSSQS